MACGCDAPLEDDPGGKAQRLFGTSASEDGKVSEFGAWRTPPEGLAAPTLGPFGRERVALGRRLFFDKRLSANGRQSCGSCHLPQLAFTDSFHRSVGSTGELHPRNAQGLANVVYAGVLTWSDPRIRSLEDQALTPLFATHPIVELGNSEPGDGLLNRLRSAEDYAAAFDGAFPGEGLSVVTLASALSAFQSVILSGESAYDRWMRGDPDGMSVEAQRGATVFASEEAGCLSCHGGPLFDRPQRVTRVEDRYANIGLYDVDGEGSYPASSPGLSEVTGQLHHRGHFRIPSLRNVALTAPYMFDGSVETLDDAVRIHLDGGRSVASGPNAGDGRRNVWRSPLLKPRTLSEERTKDLLAFLRALSDETLASDPCLRPPAESRGACFLDTPVAP
jgi:cytochrome c peroxidase